METSNTAGYIKLKLTHELDLPDSVWQGFIGELKKGIPAYQREYDKETQEWLILEKYQIVVDTLRKKYFSDNSQLGMRL